MRLYITVVLLYFCHACGKMLHMYTRYLLSVTHVLTLLNVTIVKGIMYAYTVDGTF